MNEPRTRDQVLSELRLLDAPYAQVAEAFDGFSVRTDKAGNIVRGGIAVSGQIQGSLVPEYKDEAYHVETSFVLAQQSYVRVVTGALHKLVYGRIHGVGVQYPTFSERVVAAMQASESTRFGHALGSATLSLVRQFGENYPNLMPAMQATTTTGGAEGFEVFISEAHPFLAVAFNIRDHVEEVGERIPHSVPPGDLFVLEHRPPTSIVYTYEVQCSGKKFAGALLGEAARAAVALVGSGSIAENRGRAVQDSDTAEFRANLNETIALLAARSEAAHMSGELQ